MTAAAQVLFQNMRDDETLDWLFAALSQRYGTRCFWTEWRGFGSVIRQIGIATQPVGLTIQVDADPDYVPDERDELADEIASRVSAAVVRRVRLADTRLDIMSATPNEPVETSEAITVFAFTDLDPLEAEVDRILRDLVALTGGSATDCVNGRFLEGPNANWVPIWLAT